MSPDLIMNEHEYQLPEEFKGETFDQIEFLIFPRKNPNLNFTIKNISRSLGDYEKNHSEGTWYIYYIKNERNSFPQPELLDCPFQVDEVVHGIKWFSFKNSRKGRWKRTGDQWVILSIKTNKGKEEEEDDYKNWEWQLEVSKISD